MEGSHFFLVRCVSFSRKDALALPTVRSGLRQVGPGAVPGWSMCMLQSHVSTQSEPGYMMVGKGQSQPEIAAAAFLIPYMVLGRTFYYRFRGHRLVQVVFKESQKENLHLGRGLLKKGTPMWLVVLNQFLPPAFSPWVKLQEESQLDLTQPPVWGSIPASYLEGLAPPKNG